MSKSNREGSLEAPTRHPIDWENPEFWDKQALDTELERVFDICHGCRRCVSLCNSFPSLFDLIDESSTMEVDGVDKADYQTVVDHCYLCDLCYMTKCPYVPPHEWNVDFPHLMLRAKMLQYKNKKPSLRDRVLSATDTVGKLASIPVVVEMVNAGNKSPLMRKVLSKTLGVHANASLPEYHSNTFHKRSAQHQSSNTATAAGNTKGKVALFATCYGNYNEPQVNQDLLAVFEHNNIPVKIVEKTQCCGMPKLELGDLDSIIKAKDQNIKILKQLIDDGWDIIAPIPSCVLMFKQELPLLFPKDTQVQAVKSRIFDPFEYLMIRHKHEKFNLEFKTSLGKVAYHAPCHQRVQNIGPKTRDILQLIPDTDIELIERCSGHDGTYAVKNEYHDISIKICRPVASRVEKAEAKFYSSDCPMAGHQIANTLGDGSKPTHPISLLRHAYQI